MQHGHTEILISLYDATNEHSRLTNTALGSHARALGKALTHAHLGAVARVSSPVIFSLLSAVKDGGESAIALSPAASKHEHEHAFRLPHSDLSLIYTGRGALGADVTALESGSAVLIIGDSAEELDGILGCIGKGDRPIAILAAVPEVPLREHLVARYPWALHALHISNDPAELVHKLSEELRKRHMNAKHSM